MDLTKENLSRKKFTDILFELSKSQGDLQDHHYRSNVYKKLENLYYNPNSHDCFRHFYSDIFSVLCQIKQNETLGDINILGQNLQLIKNGYQPKNKDYNGKIIDISDSINKLYDHVSLDIARMLYIDDGYWKISGEESFQNLQTELNNVSNNIVKIQQDAEEKIRNQQKEYIAILGIFSSVVLAFIGGMTFSTSVLNNISQSSTYRIFGIAIIIGIVFINMIFGLFFYINKIVNKEEKISPILISNIVLLILACVVFLAWDFGLVESRNNRVNATMQEYFSQSDNSQVFESNP